MKTKEQRDGNENADGNDEKAQKSKKSHSEDESRKLKSKEMRDTLTCIYTHVDITSISIYILFGHKKAERNEIRKLICIF